MAIYYYEEPTEDFRSFHRTDFHFERREAILISPEPAIATPNWILKTEYFGLFSDFELAMLHRGWHVAFLENTNRWGIDSDIEAKRDFAYFLREQYQLSEKCVPVGMSAGGIHAIKLAVKYPDVVHALYLDAPVINLLSLPGFLHPSERGNRESLKEEILNALDMTLSEFIGYRDHPLDKLSDLIHHKIPIILVYGKTDDIVPYSENGAMLERAYLDSGIDIAIYGKENAGHHPHGLDDPTPIVDFILKHSG